MRTTIIILNADESNCDPAVTVISETHTHTTNNKLNLLFTTHNMGWNSFFLLFFASNYHYNNFCF